MPPDACRVIVVEDHPGLLEDLVYQLEHAGFEVRGAADGRALDALMAQQGCDILVLDINLPFESGFDIARRLYDRSQRGIIMLTARADLDDKLQGLDYGANKGFRRDIFQKGLARLNAREHAAALRRICLFPLAIETSGAIVFPTPNGPASGRPELYQALMQGFSQGELSLGEMAARAEMAGKTQAQLIEVAMLLISGGHVAPKAGAVQPAMAQALNRFIRAEVMDGQRLNYFAAPALGSAIEVSFVEMVAAMLLVETPALTQAAFVSAGWQLLVSLGGQLVKDGLVLSTEEASLRELAAVFTSFQQGKTALWQRLGILPSYDKSIPS